MSIDKYIGTFAHQEWLERPPVGPITRRYIDYLQSERYGELTTCHYLSAVAHFNHWASSKRLSVSDIGAASITVFMELHLPTCDCQKPRFRGRREIAAALRHLLRLFLREGLIEPARSVSTPVSTELQAFHHCQFAGYDTANQAVHSVAASGAVVDRGTPSSSSSSSTRSSA